MNGQGEYHYKNGDIYTGEWRDDQKHGEGTYYVDEDQIKQVGQWVNNNMEGEFKIVEVDQKIKFFDNTQDASTWEWDFGDLSTGSVEKEPLHVFTEIDTLTVNLKINYPDSKNMNVTRRKVRIEITFVSEKPISFTTKIEFLDEN